MLDLHRLNYTSDNTVLFQRLSVIITDLIYSLGVYLCCSALKKSWKKDVVLPILLLANCGLIMVDHIHFQYNGMLYGILLISIAYMLQGKHILSAFWFTVLLNLKHIYIYMAPAYFVYLLRHYCLRGPLTLKTVTSKNTFKNLALLGSVVVSVFIATYLPFWDHLPQIVSRLFPFKRGLSHAYWAPNVWALYNTADKIALLAAKILNFNIGKSTTATMTGGLVQEYEHSILPSIHPIITILLTVIFTLPAMVKLFNLNRQPSNFLRCLVICALSSFLFGWHVHEKAILMAIIPLTILSIMETVDGKTFLFLSTVGHYSLFPLLFPPYLLLIKVLLLLLYTVYAFHSLYKMYPLAICRFSLPLLNPAESIYLLGLAAVFLYENVVHPALGLQNKFPFLPLMLTSAYCSLGVIYAWATYYVYFLKSDGVPTRLKNDKGNKTD
ncbi:unnamed protein product [Acanthoscelides obtectus]|nr:unnamed protein product [Acanthoscelides obtectus]CAK1676521.1 Probable dolichyl pyrophosphate Glc1Man9GlcNAc2 alpha-1,3-glucosyltransferase [Acanthoscelides obtectus]